MAKFNPNYLRSGTAWPLSGGVVNLRYSYLESAPTYYPFGGLAFGFEPLSTTQRTGVNAARNAWSGVTNINWILSAPEALGEVKVTFSINSSLAHQTVFPDAKVTDPGLPIEARGDVFFTKVTVVPGVVFANKSLTVNSPMYWTMMHEIGHALGLGHDPTTATAVAGTAAIPKAEANYLYTVMAYPWDPATGNFYPFVPVWIRDLYPVTPMMYDIAAIQRLYGKTLSSNGGQTDAQGNTKFVFTPTSHPFSRSDIAIANAPGSALMTLWDGLGSADAIVATAMDTPVWIDLRPGEFSSIGRPNLQQRNVGIAFGAEIENARGGSGDDVIIGNHLVNRLEGNGGKDRLDGGISATAGTGSVSHGQGDGADDLLFGGADADRFVIHQGGGFDTVDDEGATDRLEFRDKDTGYLPFQVVALKETGETWRSVDGRWTYVPDGAGSLIVTDTLLNNGGRASLVNFADGDYGIVRIDPWSAPQGTPARTFIGDTNDHDSNSSTPEIDRVPDGFGNYLRADGQPGRPLVPMPDRADEFFGSTQDVLERFQTGANTDTVHADGPSSSVTEVGGRDIIETGSGRDIAYAGAKDDWVEGGTETDILLGGVGNDAIYADSSANQTLTIAAAIAAGESGTGASGLGELLGGGDGNDLLVGASTEDVLFGGAGTDVIVGGVGDDTIYGDTDLVSATLGWTMERKPPNPGGALVFEVLFSNLTRQAPSDAALGQADVIYGGAGSDWVFAGGGDDYIDGGLDRDILQGEGGHDVLLGGAGNDVLSGDSTSTPLALQGDDYLNGGVGEDTLLGEGGDDVLVGGDGTFVDTLVGGDGNDTLWGGAGNDDLLGGAGRDTYIYHRGDGEDVVEDPDIGLDAEKYRSSVVVGPGITIDDVKFRLKSLMIDFGGGDALHFNGFNPDNPLATPVLDVIQFSDGSSMTYQDVLNQGFDLEGTDGDDFITGTAVVDRIDAKGGDDIVIGKAGDDSILGGAGADELNGNWGNDALEGGEGDDTLVGNEGDDTFGGGTGDDLLTGNDGADVYAFAAGDGKDVIDEQGLLAEGLGDAATDVVRFDDSVSPSQVTLLRYAHGDLVVRYGATDEITIVGQYTGTGQAIERIEFANGSVIDKAELDALPEVPITGTGGDDTLEGTSFDDTFVGEAGADTYLLYRGMGADTIVDASPSASEIGTLELAPGLTLDSLKAKREGDDLAVILRGTSDGVLIRDYFVAEQHWRIEDPDGNLIAIADLIDRPDPNAGDAVASAREDYRQGILSDWSTQTASPILPTHARVFDSWSQTTHTFYTTVNGSFVRNVDVQDPETFFELRGYGVRSGSTISGADSLVQRDISVTTASLASDDAVIMAAGTPSFTSDVIAYSVNAGHVMAGFGSQSGSSTSTFANGALSFNTVVSRHVEGWAPITLTPGEGAPGADWTLFIEKSTEVRVVESITAGASDNEIYGAQGVESGHVALIDAGDGNDIVHAGPDDFVYGNDGDDHVYGGALVYGGNGADTLEGGAQLFGGAGDDTLTGSAFLDGGSGDDHLIGTDGATTFFIDPTGVGADLIEDGGGTGDLGPGFGAAGLWELHGDTLFGVAQGFPSDYDPRASEYETFDASIWVSLVYASLDDLRADLVATGQAFRPENITRQISDNFAANDYASLELFYSAGWIELDTVEFGAGVSVGDLTMVWDTQESEDPSNGDLLLHHVLELSWGASSSVRIVLPNANDQLGSGVERFRFADGATLSIGQMLSLAPEMPPFVFEGSGDDDDLEGTDDRDVVLGLDGDDNLVGQRGDDVLAGGDGSDDLFGDRGSDRYVFEAGDVGVDRIHDAAANARDYLDWYYIEERGIAWSHHPLYAHYGEYRFFAGPNSGDDEDGYRYFGTYEEAAEEAAANYDGQTVSFMDPADIAPVVRRDDTAMLQQLVEAGVLDKDVVEFGEGLTFADLSLTVFVDLLAAEAHPELPWYEGGRLEVRWNGGESGFDLDIPDVNYGFLGTNLFRDGDPQRQLDDDDHGWRGYQLGQGVEAFRLADGTELWLEEVLQQAEVVLETPEGEFVQGDGGDNILVGTAGDDFIIGYEGNDTLRGLRGNDFLSGDDDNDFLDGGKGDDILSGGDGNDLLDGGEGDDTLDGGSGNDVYLLSSNGGHDTVNDVWWQSERVGDRIRALSPAQVFTSRDWSDLTVWVEGGASIVLPQWFSGPAGRLAGIEFDNGTFWDADEMEARVRPTDGHDVLFGSPGDDVIDALGGNDAVFGDEGDDVLWGGEGDDQLYGENGDDTLDGGPGTDNMDGGEGSDIYLFGREDGRSVVYDFDDDLNDQDTVRFDADVLTTDVIVSADPYGRLFLRIAGTDAQLVLEEWFTDTGRIERAVFEDGTEWDAAEIESRIVQAPATEFGDVITGTEGADVIHGLGGSDEIFGLGGNDLLFGDQDEDYLEDLAGNNLLIGGDGADTFTIAGGASFVAGGVGGEGIQTLGYIDDVEVTAEDLVIAYNLGDGGDSIYTSYSGEALTLSLGGGVTAADVRLSRIYDASDLVIELGEESSVVSISRFADEEQYWPSVRLQIIGEDIRIYDLNAVVAEYLVAWAQDPELLHWSAEDSLQANLLSVSTTHAFGGALAYRYATTGSVDGLTVEQMQAELAYPEFGAVAQPIGAEVEDENDAPVVTAGNATLLFDATAEASTLFSVTDADGDTITQYEFWDSTAGGGHWEVDGLEQGVNVSILVSADDLADTSFVAASTFASDQVWVRANDGEAWSAWKSWYVASAPHVTNAAPVVTAAHAELLLNDSIAADALFDVTDADGDAILGYEFWDDVAGGGYFALDGVVQGTNPITVSAGQLADLEYVAGATPGTEQVWVRASDGMGFGAWKAWNMTSALHVPNAAPTITAAASQTVTLGQEVDASTFFSAADADGDPVVRYEFWDSTAGNGHFTVDGVEQGVNVAIGVTAEQLADTQFVGSDSTGSDLVWVRANDSQSWGEWKSWNINSWPHAENHKPVVDALPAMVLTNEVVQAASFFTVADADGDAITQYEFWDDIAGGGYWRLDGVQQGAAQAIVVSDLEDLDYVGGAGGGTEQVWVRANDGLEWSAWKAWNITSALHIPNAVPVVAAANSTVLLNDAAQAASLFTVADADSDPITKYEFWDSTAGNGHWTIGGVAQGVNATIAVTAAELADTEFQAGSAIGSDLVWVRANDGQDWSSWKSWYVQSSPHLTNAAPVVTAASNGLLRNEEVSAAELFDVTDADADAITQYEFWDDVNGGGHWAVDGVQQAAAATIAVSAADLADTTYVGGANAGTEQVWARAYDGMAWSGWKNWLMSTEGGMLRGGVGPDTLNGELGPTVLEGGGGNDSLTDEEGNNVFSGGEGTDTMTGGGGNDLFVGGAGNDTVNTGAGHNVIAYNEGGGLDSVFSGAGAHNTLALGGGLDYGDLTLSKDGDDLIVGTGGDNRIAFKDWYAGNNTVDRLQLVLDEDYNAGSDDELYNRQVQSFDFLDVVAQFDAAYAQSPGLSSWAMTNALLQAHLTASDDEAIGGDLAYWYGKNGALSGISLNAAQQVLGSASFGSDAQTLRPFNGLQEGFVKLS